MGEIIQLFGKQPEPPAEPMQATTDEALDYADLDDEAIDDMIRYLLLVATS